MIHCVILDGFHRNTVIRLAQYRDVIEVPVMAKISMTETRIDRVISKTAQYKACFHAVDRDVVLYSSTGNSMDFVFGTDSVHPALTGGRFAQREPLNHFVRVQDKG